MQCALKRMRQGGCQGTDQAQLRKRWKGAEVARGGERGLRGNLLLSGLIRIRSCAIESSPDNIIPSNTEE